MIKRLPCDHLLSDDLRLFAVLCDICCGSLRFLTAKIVWFLRLKTAVREPLRRLLTTRRFCSRPKAVSCPNVKGRDTRQIHLGKSCFQRAKRARETAPWIDQVKTSPSVARDTVICHIDRTVVRGFMPILVSRVSLKLVTR